MGSPVASPPLGESSSRSAKAFQEEKDVPTRLEYRPDILWQKHPNRILKYRPAHLHYYGWMPLMVWRNWKATVFSEVYLHVQTLLLVSWVAILHLTGLGVPDKDLATLVVMFGTPFIGAIFNYCMVVVFILGLFITLVINRWWSIRDAYTKLTGTTVDLCMTISSSIQKPDDPSNSRVNRARVELTRLLNLGHLLVVAKADAQCHGYRQAYGLKTLFRSILDWMRRNSNLISKSSVDSGSPRFTKMLLKPRMLLSFETMVDEGLMNKDEWNLLEDADQDGMPTYQMVYYWTRELVNRCRKAGWILSSPRVYPLMLNKITTIAESGSGIVNTINSQMPYPYVHLVSFVVHVYLFVLSTWFGCFLHTGRLGEKFIYSDGNSVFGSATKDSDDIADSPWMVFWCYALITLANVTFQGLLDMHTLLDNPFGDHCAKFPLRASVGNMINTSRAMLSLSDKFPAAFGDVFQSREEMVESLHESLSAHRASPQEFVDFSNPTLSGEFPPGSIGSKHGDAVLSSRSSRRPREKAEDESFHSSSAPGALKTPPETPTVDTTSVFVSSPRQIGSPLGRVTMVREASVETASGVTPSTSLEVPGQFPPTAEDVFYEARDASSASSNADRV